jgi:hypothetical protein
LSNVTEQSPITHEDRHWVYFGYGVGWPRGKCDECYRLVKKYKKPNEHCINCWKLEIFFSNCTDVNKVKEYLLELAKKDHTLHGKWTKKQIEIPRHLLTSIPVEAHPSLEVKRDGGILIYTQTIKERDERKSKILADLKALGLYKKSAISYRRGCVNFDEVIGNWKTWYPLNKDYEQGAEGNKVK